MTDQPRPPSPPMSRGRRYQAYVKPGLIAFLVLSSLIPLQAIRGLVLERQQTCHAVASEIAASWGGEQRIAGPFLVLPVTPNGTVGVAGFQMASNDARDFIIVLPETLTIDGTIIPHIRHRGIYQAPLYTASATLLGGFARPDFDALGIDEKRDVHWSDARLVMFVSDLGGIVEAPALNWIGQARPLRAHDTENSFAVATFALDGTDETPWTAPFSVDLTINGNRSFGIVPIAEKTSVTVASTWLHPGFFGIHLPTESEIGDNGFRARWDLSHFVHRIPSTMSSHGDTPDWFRDQIETDAILTRLVTPVDHYLMSERSVKYGLLFVILVSCVLFVFEILSNARIHPVQYAMVAAALCLFFLLLVSLSEVIGFTGGYLIAAAMTIALLSFYVATITKSLKRGAALAGLLAIVYGYMFLTLTSEDHALLLGSLLLFTALGLTMVATRRLDWYALGERLPGQRDPTAAAR